MISKLCSKDYFDFIDCCLKFDKYSDFYIFEDKRKIFLNDAKVSKRVFNDVLKRGDKCFVHKEREIEGIALINGYKYKSPFKYLKIFSYKKQVIEKLLRFINMNYSGELYLRVKHYNPVAILAKDNHFRVIKEIGKEVLMKREAKNGSR